MQIRLSKNYTRTEEQRLSSIEDGKLTESSLQIKLYKKERMFYTLFLSPKVSKSFFPERMMHYGNLKQKFIYFFCRYSVFWFLICPNCKACQSLIGLQIQIPCRPLTNNVKADKFVNDNKYFYIIMERTLGKMLNIFHSCCDGHTLSTERERNFT